MTGYRIPWDEIKKGSIREALTADIFGAQLLDHYPITMHFSAWYSGIGLTGQALLPAFALYSLHTSLGGQPLFGRSSLEDWQTERSSRRPPPPWAR